MPKKWKNIKAKESTPHRKMASSLIKHINANPSSYPRTMEEIMEIFGLDFSRTIVNNYHNVQNFFIQQRKKMNTMVEDFLKTGDYEKAIKQGFSEDDIFRQFVDTMLSYEVVPLYSDRDDKYRYKLLDLPSWHEMIKDRIRRIGKEFENKIDSIRTSMKMLPESTKKELEVLTGKSEEIQKYLSSVVDKEKDEV